MQQMQGIISAYNSSRERAPPVAGCAANNSDTSGRHVFWVGNLDVGFLPRFESTRPEKMQDAMREVLEVYP